MLLSRAPKVPCLARSCAHALRPSALHSCPSRCPREYLCSHNYMLACGPGKALTDTQADEPPRVRVRQISPDLSQPGSGGSQGDAPACAPPGTPPPQLPEKQQRNPSDPPLPRQNVKVAPPSPPRVITDKSRTLQYTRVSMLGEVSAAFLLPSTPCLHSTLFSSFWLAL